MVGITVLICVDRVLTRRAPYPRCRGRSALGSFTLGCGHVAAVKAAVLPRALKRFCIFASTEWGLYGIVYFRGVRRHTAAAMEPNGTTTIRP